SYLMVLAIPSSYVEVENIPPHFFVRIKPSPCRASNLISRKCFEHEKINSSHVHAHRHHAISAGRTRTTSRLWLYRNPTDHRRDSARRLPGAMRVVHRARAHVPGRSQLHSPGARTPTRHLHR